MLSHEREAQLEHKAFDQIAAYAKLQEYLTSTVVIHDEHISKTWADPQTREYIFVGVGSTTSQAVYVYPSGDNKGDPTTDGHKMERDVPPVPGAPEAEGGLGTVKQTIQLIEGGEGGIG